MQLPQNNSRFLAFLDECGDHSLEKIDKDFPLFVLSAIIVERSDYVEKIIPEITKLKLKFWNHEGVNLHSRDIRRACGDFSFMQVPKLRESMMESLNLVMKNIPFALFLAAIDKHEHKTIHGTAAINPYDLALSATLENMTNFLRKTNETILPIVAESRGAKEDGQLKDSFYELINSNHTNNWPDFSIIFRSKYNNIAGLQIADLCAYPAARKILKPEKINPSYESIHSHIYAYEKLSVITKKEAALK